MRVALVVMPWSDARYAPLGVASLKAYLEARGIRTDCLHLGLRFMSHAGGVTPILWKFLSFPWPEWFFAYHLFGPGGTGEIREDLDDIYRKGSFREFARKTQIPRSRLEKLLRSDIPAFLQECADLPWDQYDIVGFSSSFATHAASLKLAKEIKSRHPGKPIVFGGANVEGPMGVATLKGCEWIDYVVDGEGEEALFALVENIRTGDPYRSIPRVSFRQGERITLSNPQALRSMDMDRLPTPNHDDFFREWEQVGQGRSDKPTVTFEASRGCWWGQKQHCTFCGVNGQSMGYRSKSTELVLQDILRLHRRYRARRLQACDNILSLQHIDRLLPELARVRKEHGLDWDIFFEVKSNLAPAQIKSMAEAGLKSIQPGFESLSTPTLRLMRKGVRAIQNVQTLKAATASGMEILWGLLCGFPGEDPAEYGRMADTVLSLLHLSAPVYNTTIRIDRFSPYHFDWQRMGIRKPKPNPNYAYLYPVKRFDLEDIAYFFELDPPLRMPAYAKAYEEACDLWRSVWRKNFFAYAQGLGFVELYDSRPREVGQAPEYREHLLEGLEARIFQYCNEIRTFGEIRQDCHRFDNGIAEERILGILKGMQEKRWLMQEENFYLNLAVPVSSLLPAQSVALEHLRRVTEQYFATRESVV